MEYVEHQDSTNLINDDLFDDSIISNPYKYFKNLRKVDPIHWNELHKIWVITCHDDIVDILSNPDVFSSQVISRIEEPFPPVEQNDLALYEFVRDYIAAQIDEQDGEVHSRMRKVLQPRFTPRSLERLRSQIQNVIGELIDDLDQKRTVDFKEEFALPLPIRIIMALIGIKRDLHEHVRDLTQKILLSSQSESDRLRHQADGMNGLLEIVAPLVEEREKSPNGDLISVMIEGAKERVFDRHGLLVNIAMLIVSGHETTVNLLCNGLLSFLQFPDQWRKLGVDANRLVKPAVEECLRYDSPVKSIQRIVAQDVVIGGKSMRRGDRVRCFISSANRDPRVFEKPEEFYIDRTNNRHVAFGNGKHTCLGASLARLEAQESFRLLSSRYPKILLCENELSYRPSISHRSLKSLQVDLFGGG